MDRTRRIAVAATVGSLAASAGIAAFALQGGAANAAGIAGRCQINNLTPVGGSGHQQCAIPTVTITTPSLVVLGVVVGQVGDTVQFSWTSTCFKNGGSLGTHSGTVSFTSTGGLNMSASTRVDPTSVAAHPSSCTVTASEVAMTSITGGDIARLTLSAFGGPVSTPSPTARATDR